MQTIDIINFWGLSLSEVTEVRGVVRISFNMFDNTRDRLAYLEEVLEDPPLFEYAIYELTKLEMSLLNQPQIFLN